MRMLEQMQAMVALSARIVDRLGADEQRVAPLSAYPRFAI